MRHIISSRNLFRSASATFLASAFTLSSSASLNYVLGPRQDDALEAALEHIDRYAESRSMPPDLSRTSGGNVSALPPAGAASNISVEPGTDSSSVTSETLSVEEVKQYLWSVYQRSSTKLDSHGDFTWKDAAAASRLGLTVREYVIDGMDRDFREQLFAAGQAMDAAGIDWTILSAFRDDYRQSLAVGLKAHTGNSFHGGSTATGGYGHGCAVDLASTDGGISNYAVWNWLDQYGSQFGLFRPLRGIDPAHVQPSAGWRAVGATLRDQRLKGRSEVAAADVAQDEVGQASFPLSADSVDTNLSEEQYNCVRPRPAQETERPARIVSHLKSVIARLLPGTAEASHWKAKWKTAAAAATHRMSGRKPLPESPNRHAKLKQGARLAG